MVRRLDNVEKALWGRVIETVKPLHVARPNVEAKPSKPAAKSSGKLQKVTAPVASKATVVTPAKRSEHTAPPRHHNLDGHWDRRIHRGAIVPDISIDLHDANLTRAYSRLDGALEQAIAQNLKVILLVTGKPRSHDRASGEGRGAIAAVVRDWLGASRHARHISAVRYAHPRHGGTGALYIILKG